MDGMLLAPVAVVLAATALLLLAGSGPLYQLELLSLQAAFTGLRVAVGVGIAALIAGLGELVVAWRVRSIPHLAIGVGCVLAGVTAVNVPLRARHQALAAAPLHDVTTDVENPPTFTALLELYQEQHRTLARGPAVDALQRRAYPDLHPIMLPETVDMAYEDVLETMNEIDWPVAAANPDEGRVEAMVRSPWFGFRDDVVIRLTPQGSSTRVDVRSVTRDGANDMGRNARHVREFLEELQR
jgi:uncharacterized protein (DUF1499 family)